MFKRYNLKQVSSKKYLRMTWISKITKRWKKSFPTPVKDKTAENESLLSLLTCLSPMQWVLFISGYCCWLSDAYDYYCGIWLLFSF